MKIVVLDGETINPGDNPWTLLESVGGLTVFAQTQADDVLARSVDADILVTNKVNIDASLISKLPRLKFIAIMATGHNVVDVAAASENQVLVSNVPAYSTSSVAQHVFAGLLALLHRPELHHDAIHSGEWAESGNFSFWKIPLMELNGKTLGIVGLGQIGRAVAKIAVALEMTVVAHSRTEKDPLDNPGFAWLDLPTLFAQADVISLHCPQTDDNREFVNQELLTLMKPTAVLINTARGGLVNETDLAHALNSKQLAGAFLDVVSTEPIQSDNPLLKACNCLLTPHLGWATIESRRRLMQATAENVAAFIGGSPINLVRNVIH